MTLKDTSKFLSYVLRHKPESIGITLDENGWVDVQALINATQAQGRPVTLELIERVVETNDKKRFVIRDGRIRANQGHSVKIELGLSAKEPPTTLFHGTALKHLPSIQSSGLRSMNRQHVHLSLDVDTALTVGRRHGKPVILKVHSKKMSDSGFDFFLSENNVWLVKEVPARYLEIVENDA